MHRWLRPATALVVVAVLASACGQEGGVEPIDPAGDAEGTDDGGAAPPPGASDGPSPDDGAEDEVADDDPATVDTGTVPAEIDAVYVEAVLAEYAEAFAPVFQGALDEGALTDEFAVTTQAWWTDPWLGRVQSVYMGWLEEDDAVRDEIEPRYYEVTELVVAEEDCIVVTAVVDNAAWAADPGDDSTLEQAAALVPHDGDADPEENPTPWQLNFDANVTDGEAGEQLCS